MLPFFRSLFPKKKSSNSRLTAEEIGIFQKYMSQHNSRFKIEGCINKLCLFDSPFRASNQKFMRQHFNLTSDIQKCDAVVGWGFNRKSFDLLQLAIENQKPFIAMEDGFIRSLYTWVANVPPELKSGLSYVSDSKGFYFDGSVATDLEHKLNTETVTETECAKASELISYIVENKISKYNNQPLELTTLGKTNKPKVLVIDQSYGDMSLICGGITDQIFQQMILDAIDENPESEILFKIHPDTIARAQTSGFEKLIPETVTIISDYVNPITMLEHVDKVYVATSQLGFEALMCNKTVHVYGMPFYAGWGLTVDKIKNPRRKRTLSIEEMFCIVYQKYSTYIDPENGHESSIEKVIHHIVSLRDSLHN